MSETDQMLLVRYVQHRAEDAFAEIVRRHVNLVYSAVLRSVHSPSLAEDVTQAVFLKLAVHAQILTPRTVLAAWLYQVARRESIDIVRREARRQAREQVAAEANDMNAAPADWAAIEPILNEAMDTLDETDRAAVLLRYFENQSLREVGAALGLSENAAQKRVSRAVERLRCFLSHRGLGASASLLIALISSNGTGAAPAGLVTSISTAAGTLARSAVPATTAKTILMTTLQKAILTGTVAVVAIIGIRQALKPDDSEKQADKRSVAAAPVTQEADELRLQIQNLSERAAAERSELLQLRGEVGRWRRGEMTSSQAAANANGDRRNLRAEDSNAEVDAEDVRIQVKVRKLKELLNLSDEQEKALKDLLTRQSGEQAELNKLFQESSADAPILAKLFQTKERSEAEIEFLLTPEQKAAYVQARSEEWSAFANISARSELLGLQNAAGLSQEQQDLILPILQQQNLKEQMRMEGGNSTVADGAGVPPQTVRQSVIQSIDQRLAALRSILSAEQLQTYQELLAMRLRGMEARDAMQRTR